ncbi:predicted protein [Nematostella vectensis]|uniref:Guanine nucleotide-binding protein subunit gamma n=1 Tax=Nematostella vectensis TaxID=45351 RepID=A7SI97_NEMVE|nr:predicted protein [Nematostella vectensis]|eukprot:XP_001628599.1 predicted protein [Nematostella vectensis]
MATQQAQISTQRAVVDQLRGELKVTRMKVSQTSVELMKFCENHCAEDPLVHGLPPGDNPFREKTSCTLF